VAPETLGYPEREVEGRGYAAAREHIPVVDDASFDDLRFRAAQISNCTMMRSRRPPIEQTRRCERHGPRAGPCDNAAARVGGADCVQKLTACDFGSNAASAMAHPTAAWHDQQVGRIVKHATGSHRKSERSGHGCLRLKAYQSNVNIGALAGHETEYLYGRREVDLVGSVIDEHTNPKLSFFFVLSLSVWLACLGRRSCGRKPVSYSAESRKGKQLLRERAAVQFLLLVSRAHHRRVGLKLPPNFDFKDRAYSILWRNHATHDNIWLARVGFTELVGHGAVSISRTSCRSHGTFLERLVGQPATRSYSSNGAFIR